MDRAEKRRARPPDWVRLRTCTPVVLIALIALAVSASVADAKRSKVYINKQPAPYAIDASRTIPLAAVPPALIAFDLVRRTSCDPRIAVSTGKGDPGFDPAGPLTGNFLWPAINRRDSYCYKPK